MNNKFKDCPARMSDGRIFTDYRPGCFLNNSIRASNKLINNFDYRMYLTRNADKIINYNKETSTKINSCDNCSNTMLPESTKVVCNKEVCQQKVVNTSGLGQGRQ